MILMYLISAVSIVGFVALLHFDFTLLKRRGAQLSAWVAMSRTQEELDYRKAKSQAILDSPEFAERLKFLGSTRILIRQIWRAYRESNTRKT